MKRFLLALAFTTCALTAKAQTTTNLAYRVTIETVTAGVTNSTQSTVRLDYGTKKEALMIDGLAKAYRDYVIAGGVATFEAWLKTDIKDRAREYSNAKIAVDNAAMAAKINTLLTTQSDLLSAAQLNQLIAIAALLP